MTDKWSKYEVDSDPKEDKWSKYEVKSDDKKEPMSKWESLLRGAIQGSTMGFGDEIQAGLRAISPIQINADEKGRPTIGLNQDFGEYKKLRDAERANNATSSKDNPGMTLAGNIVGSLPAAMNIANVARVAAPIAGSQVLGSGIAGASAGAGLGAIQGTGQANSVSDIPKEAGTQALIGAGTGALTGTITGKAVQKYGDATMAGLKGEAPATAKAAGLLQSVSLPGLGALGGMGYRNVQTEDPIDWTTDPYSAAVETGIAGLKGAALGAAAQQGAKFGGKAADAIVDKAGKVFTGLGKSVDHSVPKMFGNKAGNMIGSMPNATGRDAALASPGTAMDSFTEYLRSMPDAEQRKTVMDLQTTAQGRAKTNTESPLKDEDENR